MKIDPLRIRVLMAKAEIAILGLTLVGGIAFLYLFFFQHDKPTPAWQYAAALALMMPYEVGKAWEHIREEKCLNINFLFIMVLISTWLIFVYQSFA